MLEEQASEMQCKTALLDSVKIMFAVVMKLPKMQESLDPWC